MLSTIISEKLVGSFMQHEAMQLAEEGKLMDFCSVENGYKTNGQSAQSIIKTWSVHFAQNNVPFLTTSSGKKTTIWKRRVAIDLK